MITESDVLRVFPPDDELENPKDRIGVTKPNLDLIPPAAEILEAGVMRLGAEKYGPFNWREKRIRTSIYVAAARRHLAQWQDGEDLDAESSLPHLAHARACLGILLDAVSLDRVIDDRPPPGNAAALIQQFTRNP